MAFRRPEEFLDLLEPVVAQDDLKRKLAAAFSDYTLYLENEEAGKPTVLVYGESGAGKSHAVETICEASGLPYTWVSGAGMSVAAHKGLTYRDLLMQHVLKHRPKHRLYDKGGEDFFDGRQSVGVIFVDEVDKWCVPMGRQGSDVAGIGLRMQAETLRMIDTRGDDVMLTELEPDDGETPEDVTIKTKDLLWIFAGAFGDIHLSARDRFHEHYPTEELWSQLLPSDFVNYGMMREFAGRIGTWAWVKPLKRHEMIDILRQQQVPKWELRFNAIGCAVTIDDSALAKVTERAVQERTGVRGATAFLRRTVEDLFVEASVHRLKELTVTASTVQTGRLEFDEPDLKVV